MNKDFLEVPQTDVETTLDSLSDDFSGGCSINDIETMANTLLKTLPKINRAALREEMSNMEVETFETPTTFDINSGLAKCTGYRDRLTEILTLATREYKLRKRVIDMLFDATNVVSKQSSADKRKGEATLKYALQLLQLEASETFMKEVEQILGNIRSISETISRQGSIIQSQISLGEYRKVIPNDNFGGEAEEVDYHSGVKKVKYVKQGELDWDNF